jgi:hypothetical protein
MTDVDLAALSAAAYTAAPTWAADDVHAVRTGALIAFRDTVPTSMAVWWRDFDAVPIHNVELGWCHEGFFDGAQAVLPAILPDLDGPVTVTGHSLGGALAALTVASLVATGRAVARLVTFGAPRAGGSGVARCSARRRCDSTASATSRCRSCPGCPTFWSTPYN